MSKKPATKQEQPAQPTAPITPLSSSGTYKIEKYGQYAYQLMMVIDGLSIKVGAPNTYPVVASNLMDRLIDEINRGNR